jgi:parvulin-like peptidyl-prolyl isomerase
MSILESMRSGTDSTFMQVLLAVVVVSFVFWFATPQGDVAAEVANVNGTRIMTPDVEREMRRAFGGRAPNGDEEYARAQGLVVDSLVDRELMRQAAVNAGLSLDVDRDSRISWSVAQTRGRNPQFLDEEQAFDEELYRAGIRYLGYTADEYEALLQKQSIISKMQRLMTYGVVVPDAMLRSAYQEMETKARLRFVRLRPANFNDEVDDSDTAVEAWIVDNPGSVEAEYTATQDSLTTPEQVNVRMLVFKMTGDGQGAAELRPRMQILKDEIDASADPDATMDELARQWSEHVTADDGGSLGTVGVGDLSQDVLDGIEGLEVGQLSDITFSGSMLALYMVNERTEARTPSVEEVRLTIGARLMRERETPALAAAFAEELQASWTADGTAPIERLADLRLTVQTSGMLNKQSPFGALSPPSTMVAAALIANGGDVLPEVYQSGEALYVGVVDSIERADMGRFDQEREAIRRSVVQQRRAEFLRAYTADLKSQASL